MKHLDLTYIIENVTTDKKFICELLQVFRESLAEDLKTLASAIEDENHDLIKRSGHKLKSSFRSLGMTEMANSMFKIELMGFNADEIKSIKETFMAVVTEIKDVNAEVNDYLKLHQ